MDADCPRAWDTQHGGGVAVEAPHKETADDAVEAHGTHAVDDAAAEGEPVADMDNGTFNMEQVDARRRSGGIADGGRLPLTMTAPAYRSASPRRGGACTDAATDTLAAMRVWVAALEVEQDEATADAVGDTHTPGGNGRNCVEVYGVCADGADKCHANDEAEHRAMDGVASPSADGSAERYTNYEAEHRAVDGIASPSAGAKSAEGCAAKCRASHVPGDSIYGCSVEMEGAGADRAAERCAKDDTERCAVDGNNSPRAGTSAEGCTAERHAPGSSNRCGVKLE